MEHDGTTDSSIMAVIDVTTSDVVQRTPAVDVWSQLIAGRSRLLERNDGARRLYLVLENPATARSEQALTPGERDVVEYVARGISAKFAAYSLAVSTTAISQRLARAAAKLGLSSRTELVRVAAMLIRGPRREKPLLTKAEREILELIAQGRSNAEIARLRRRSRSTVANQVAGLLRKTNSPTRRALVARAS
jgi:DNA-binding CsgD family transcriptional regulator